MAILKLESFSEYAKYMKEHPDEGQKLYDDVLIPVTSFFRDFEAFEALKTEIYPAIVKEVGNKGTIRMWAPGCSTGEETYSLAMTLLEFLGDKALSYQVQIFGTDLNEKGIEKARTGLYRASIADEMSPERLQRFFVKVDDGYRVNKTVRDMCIFARQNLANDPPFSQMNLVACRNLLIYIQPILQKKIIPILHYALKPSGFLMMGSSESASGFPDLFSTLDKKNKIYSKKPTASRLPYDFAQSYRPSSSSLAFSGKLPKREGAATEDSNLEAEADRIILKSHAPVGVVVNAAMEVIQFRGRTTPYLESPPGKSSLNLLKLARHGLAIELRTLIGSAVKKDISVQKERFIFEGDGHKRILNLSVSPLEDESSEDNRFFLVLFDDITAHTSSGSEISSPRRRKSAAEDTREATRMKKELADSRDALHAAIESEDALKEEFQSANEEILSANEELQSTNEELETSKEELQSANEELNTLNEELRTRNVDLGQLNNDLANLLDAIRIPVIFVGADLRIRRLTSAATDIFRVLPSDVGRPITDIKHNLDVPDFAKLIQDTVANLTSTEREVQDLDGRWRSLEIRPYRTSDNRIEGAVVALPDIDRLKQAEQYLKKIIDNIPNPLLVLDMDLKVLLANLTFCKTFEVSQAATIGETLYRLGNEQWNIPRLKELLEKILPKNESVKDYVVTHDFPDIGQKTMLVSGRRIEGVSRGSSPMILLAIEDVTERRQAEAEREVLSKTLEQQSRTFDTTLSSITDFAYTFNREGRFIYVNPPLLNLWGLKLEEAIGKNFFELPYSEEMAARLQSQIQQVIATRKTVADETPYTNPTGVTRYYEYIFNPVIAADGTVELVAGSTRDITERRLAEAALIKSEKLAAAGRLAATLAHEINNPLQAVTNLITILKGSKNLDAQDQTFATMAEEELNRVTRLTQQSLAFYRESIAPSSVTPEEVLDTILNLYGKRTAAKTLPRSSSIH
jgi:two-component system CheB/CheR fusion protein